MTSSPLGGGDFEPSDVPGRTIPGRTYSGWERPRTKHPAFVGIREMSTFPASQPSRTGAADVGIISAGRVGTALGEALEKAGHVVAGVVARSSLSRACRWLPESPILDVDAVVA